MKKITLIFVAVLAALCATAQTFFWVYKHDGTFIKYIISETDSITLTQPSTLTLAEKCKASDYKWVNIGTQTWMAENYRCTKYDTESEAYNASWLTNNTIPTSADAVYTPYFTDATDKSKWNTEDGDCSGNLSNEQIAKLGYLYNWAAAVGVKDGTQQFLNFTVRRQGICPNGWHIPTNEEWEILKKFIENNRSTGRIGTYLKTKSGWYEDGNGTDVYEFAALPSGHGGSNCVYEVGLEAEYWSATINTWNEAYQWYLFCGDDSFSKFSFYRSLGLSVRCLKN